VPLPPHGRPEPPKPAHVASCTPSFRGRPGLARGSPEAGARRQGCARAGCARQARGGVVAHGERHGQRQLKCMHLCVWIEPSGVRIRLGFVVAARGEPLAGGLRGRVLVHEGARAGDSFRPRRQLAHQQGSQHRFGGFSGRRGRARSASGPELVDWGGVAGSRCMRWRRRAMPATPCAARGRCAHVEVSGRALRMDEWGLDQARACNGSWVGALACGCSGRRAGGYDGAGAGAGGALLGERSGGAGE
jgi:hypothetical protein